MGKAWLYLSKAYQNFGSKGNQAKYKEKSEAALFRHASLSTQRISPPVFCTDWRFQCIHFFGTCQRLTYIFRM